MLETVIVDSEYPLTLNVENASHTDMLIVKSISGLTSAKVGLFTGDYASEGSYYQGRRPEKLNPVLTLKMNPDYANDVEVSDIRETLYRTFFHPYQDADGVIVRLQDDRRPERYFIGYCEDINTDQFSKDTSVQISLVCMDGYLFSYTPVSGADAAGWASLAVQNEGSAKCGILATFKVNTATSVLTFEINDRKLILNRAFTVGQVVTIDTRKGSRSIKVGGTDIMAALDPASEWLQMDLLGNNIKAYGSVVGDGKVVMTSYTFRPQWWGL